MLLGNFSVVTFTKPAPIYGTCGPHQAIIEAYYSTKECRRKVSREQGYVNVWKDSTLMPQMRRRSEQVSARISSDRRYLRAMQGARHADEIADGGGTIARFVQR